MAELSSGVIILLYVRVQRLVWRIANPLSKPLQRRFGYNLLFSAAGYRLENLGQATNKRRFENALRVRVQSFAFFSGWLFRPLSVIGYGSGTSEDGKFHRFCHGCVPGGGGSVPPRLFSVAEEYGT